MNQIKVNIELEIPFDEEMEIMWAELPLDKRETFINDMRNKTYGMIKDELVLEDEHIKKVEVTI